MKTVEIGTRCPFCGKQNKVVVDKTGHDEWVGGLNIQAALPDLSPEDRELLISGICDKCWKDTFG